LGHPRPGVRPLAVSGLWHRSGVGLDACQAAAGGGAGHLPRGVRADARHLRAARKHPRTPLLPLVQRGAGTDTGARPGPGGGQTFLNTMTDPKPRKTLSLAPRARTKPSEDGDTAGRRTRSGARARQAALRQREQEKLSATESAPVAKPAAARPAAPRAGAPRPSASRAEAPRRQRERAMPGTLQVFAPCPQGLEDALAAELSALGYDAVRKGRAGCPFEAAWPGVLKANLYSRRATRILVRVAHAPVRTEDDILALARETEWERWFGPEHTLRVDTSAVRSPMQS